MDVNDDKSSFPHARLLSKTAIGFVPMWRMAEGDDALVSA
jgi:hypothetical protein